MITTYRQNESLIELLALACLLLQWYYPDYFNIHECSPLLLLLLLLLSHIVSLYFYYNIKKSVGSIVCDDIVTKDTANDGNPISQMTALIKHIAKYKCNMNENNN